MTTPPVIAVTMSSWELSRMSHWRRMFLGLQQAGAVTLSVDCAVQTDVAPMVQHADGLLLSGGGDVDPRRYGGDPDDPTLGWVDPVRDANEAVAFEAAKQRGIPVLAICRGSQLVNVLEGGTLYADLKRDRGADIDHEPGDENLVSITHEVTVEPASRVAQWMGIAGHLGVNGQHHQGVRDLAPGYVVTALAPDGLVEGFESTSLPVTAVQWHPEVNWEWSLDSRKLIAGFVQSCRR